MLQVSGYSQLTSTCREFCSGFSCRFMGGSGLTVEEDKETPFVFLGGLWCKVVLPSDPTFPFVHFGGAYIPIMKIFFQMLEKDSLGITTISRETLVLNKNAMPEGVLLDSPQKLPGQQIEG